MGRPDSKARVLILHVGWARSYRGDPGDIPQGKFGFLKWTDDTPGESFNFRKYGGRCYGYAPHHTLNLARLGGTDDESVDGVLVVWTASNPDKSGRYVVGWYKDARVYAEGRKVRPEPGNDYVIAEAPFADCRVLPVDDRTFYVPRMEPGYPGIASAFYASDLLSPGDLDELLAYVDGKPSIGFFKNARPGPPGSAGPSRRRDDADPREVEQRAIEAVCAHYDARGWTIETVETENLGWDLQATKGARVLLIEVKGRSGGGSVELTPNEYAKMSADRTRMSYRLAIVHDALTKPTVTIFGFSPGLDAWVSELGHVLEIRPATGAVVRF